MNYRAGWLLVGALMLAACAGGDWPGQTRPDPTVEEYSVVQQRWASAAKQPLGTAQDAAEIAALLGKAHPDMKVREIRWLSATEAMAQCVRGDELAIGEEIYYGALKKSAAGWQLVAWYSALFS